jgi:hypothetical protein
MTGLVARGQQHRAAAGQAHQLSSATSRIGSLRQVCDLEAPPRPLLCDRGGGYAQPGDAAEWSIAVIDNVA